GTVAPRHLRRKSADASAAPPGRIPGVAWHAPYFSWAFQKPSADRFSFYALAECKRYQYRPETQNFAALFHLLLRVTDSVRRARQLMFPTPSIAVLPSPYR